MTLPEFYQLVDKVHRDNPSYRVGQSLFNTLFDIRPDISEMLRATKDDPFYATEWDDPRVVGAMNVIKLMWEEK